MRVFIAGVDGYLGWSLAQHLLARGHDVAGADAFLRRRWVHEMGSWSATPVYPMPERLQALEEHFGKDVQFWEGDLTHYELVAQIFEEFRPDAIVHLGECPSAPYSMIDAEHCAFVQTNNLVSTTNFVFAMRAVRPRRPSDQARDDGGVRHAQRGDPRGVLRDRVPRAHDRMPFPRQAGSWYHWSKVHGSNNVMFACKLWGLRATDIMQGVVFGTRIDDMAEDDRLLTRLDFDQAFGTADQPVLLPGADRPSADAFRRWATRSAASCRCGTRCSA